MGVFGLQESINTSKHTQSSFSHGHLAFEYKCNDKQDATI